jgi:tricorn protease-like protein
MRLLRRETGCVGKKEHAVCYAASGKQIVVNAAHGDGDNNWYFPNLDVIAVSSGKLQTLLKPEFQIKYPRWSPDGKQIAFLGGLMAGDLVGNYGDVYVVPTADGQARNLTANWPA